MVRGRIIEREGEREEDQIKKEQPGGMTSSVYQQSRWERQRPWTYFCGFFVVLGPFGLQSLPSGLSFDNRSQMNLVDIQAAPTEQG